MNYILLPITLNFDTKNVLSESVWIKNESGIGKICCLDAFTNEISRTTNKRSFVRLLKL